MMAVPGGIGPGAVDDPDAARATTPGRVRTRPGQRPEAWRRTATAPGDRRRHRPRRRLDGAGAISYTGIAWDRRALCSTAAAAVTVLVPCAAPVSTGHRCARCARPRWRAPSPPPCWAAPCSRRASGSPATSAPWSPVEGAVIGRRGRPRRALAVRALVEGETFTGHVPAHGGPGGYERGRQGAVDDAQRRARARLPDRRRGGRHGLRTSPGEPFPASHRAVRHRRAGPNEPAPPVSSWWRARCPAPPAPRPSVGHWGPASTCRYGRGATACPATASAWRRSRASPCSMSSLGICRGGA